MIRLFIMITWRQIQLLDLDVGLEHPMILSFRFQSNFWSESQLISTIWLRTTKQAITLFTTHKKIQEIIHEFGPIKIPRFLIFVNNRLLNSPTMICVTSIDSRTGLVKFEINFHGILGLFDRINLSFMKKLKNKYKNKKTNKQNECYAILCYYEIFEGGRTQFRRFC